MEFADLRFVVDENTLAVGKVMQQLRDDVAYVGDPLPGLVDPHQRIGDHAIRLRKHGDPQEVADALRAVDPSSLVAPAVSDSALAGLKFASALPPELARETLSSRFADKVSAQQVLSERRSIIHCATRSDS